MEIKTNYISKFFFSKNDTVPVGHMVDELMGICCSFRLDKAEWVNNLESEKPYEDIEQTVIHLKMVSVVVSPFYWSKNRAVLYNHKVYAFYAF